MSSLGFRHPQFSEDFAWLPTWLQNPQLEASASSFKEPQSNFSQVETLSSEKGRYKSFSLFLSGDDTSQTTLHPSPGNALHLRLRLSSDGESQDCQSKSIDASKTQLCSSDVPSVQQIETSIDLQERMRHSKAGSNPYEAVELFPLSSSMALENVCPQSLANNDETERRCGNLDGAVLINSSLPALEHVNLSSSTNCIENKVHEERFNVINMEDSDVSEAVELSIAASEALVVHELMRTDSTHEILQAKVILEAALQVKQARLKALGDGIALSSHDIDDIDFLSDLDDLTMESAFQDVGLLYKDLDDQHDCLDVSLVKDTPLSENLNVDNDEPEKIELVTQQDKMCDGSALGLNNMELVVPSLDHPIEKISDVLAAEQPQADASSSPACLSENTGVYGACPLANKFRSRWLGGWAVKGADVPAMMKQNSAKCIPKLFYCETSSLSESGGVAADENSFLQNHEVGSKIASQSSGPLEGALDKADEGNFILPEVRSSNQSMADPLCSVVPCSISTEDPSVQNQDDGEAHSQNNFDTKLELGTENFLNLLDLKNESLLLDRETRPTINGENSKATVRRKLASLKTYSTLSTKHDVIINGQRVSPPQGLSSKRAGELLSSNRTEHDHSGFCKKNSNSSLPGVGGHGQNQEVFVFGVPADHDEPAKDEAEMVHRPPVQRTSPRILNRKGRCRLHPSEFLVEDLAGKRSLELHIGAQCQTLHNEKFQNIKSNMGNPHSAPNMVRKRVHFADMKHHQSNNIQKPQTSQRNCSAIRANKKPRYSKLRSGSWTKDIKNCFTNQISEKKTLIFHRQEFLLTGFSSRKEREIVRLINEYGGMVLSDVPSPPSNFRSTKKARSTSGQLPIIISSKKLQTAKFLYGCAVNALILKLNWLADSVAAGSRLPPAKYMILPSRTALPYTESGKSYDNGNSRQIFDRIGIMLHGKPSFCTKSALIIKHGGGQVFKTLQRLFQSLDTEKISVGAIVAEEASKVSRHLKHCASERKLVILPANWLAKSLHLGKLLPIKEKDDITTMATPHSAISMDWSQEI